MRWSVRVGVSSLCSIGAVLSRRDVKLVQSQSYDTVGWWVNVDVARILPLPLLLVRALVRQVVHVCCFTDRRCCVEDSVDWLVRIVVNEFFELAFLVDLGGLFVGG